MTHQDPLKQAMPVNTLICAVSDFLRQEVSTAKAHDFADECERTLAALTTAQPTIPKGYVLMPMRETPAMRRVMESGEWEWEELLEAAEAITEEQYAELQEPPQPQAQEVAKLPAGMKVADVGFRWDSEAKQHIPHLLIEFEPVPANSPNDSKGWADRDALAAMLTAAPQAPQPDALVPLPGKRLEELWLQAINRRENKRLPDEIYFGRLLERAHGITEKGAITPKTADKSMESQRIPLDAIEGMDDTAEYARKK